jgi:TolB-like protein
MSRVFLARDVQLGREVVVKVMSPELAQELSVERFGREIALAAALQHANIVPVLSAGVTAEGVPYYLMPFVEGASLRDLVAGGKPLPIADVLLVLNDVARALAYAHGRGVVHRDIKPDNVMLSGGAALVTDFGIAKAMSSARATSPENTLTRMGTSIGTPSYMAPEQGAGDPDTDHRADLYAFGAMAYELLTGATPFGDRPAHALLIAHLAEAPVPVAERRRDTPEPLAQLVMQCLKKDPAERPQTANALLESLADASSALRMAATGQYSANTATQATATRPRSRAGVLVAGLAVIAAAAGGWYLWRNGASAKGPDATSLAVMPFTVRDASLEVWREGLVDILSRSLDGAGALHTVAPSASIANAPARADAATATAHAKTLGAGLALFGDLNAVGPDSVRVRAAIIDVSTGKVRHDIDVSGAVSRMDALADSVALRVIRALGTGGELGGGARIASIGTSSLPALKSYLQGVQFYRRGVVDSSLTAFESAAAADSAFSLAWRGVASIYIRTGREAAPEAQAALDRAIRFKAGRSPRDSLLLTGDSLRLAVVRRKPTDNDVLAEVPAVTALFATLREATRRYPGDAELWLELGDAGYHFGALGGVADSVVLADFTRAIALDTNVLVPYVHAHALALRTNRQRDAAVYARALARLAVGPTGAYYRLQAALLDSAPAISSSARTLADSLPAQFAASVLSELMVVPEAAPLALALANAQNERLTGNLSQQDSAGLATTLRYVRAWGGVLDAATLEGLRPGDRAQLALIGVLPRETALAEARMLLDRQPAVLSPFLPMLAAARDTQSIARIAVALDSIDRSAATSGRPTTSGDYARAMDALARGDSVAALRGMLRLSMSGCNDAPCGGFTLAQLLARAGRDADAAKVLDRWMPSGARALIGPGAMLLRAQIAERLGDGAGAQLWYQRVLARWGAGGAEVQSMLSLAREGAKRTARKG